MTQPRPPYTEKGIKNKKLLSDEALRNDLYIEMMFMAGTLGYYQAHPEQMTFDRTRHAINEQINLLMPTIKRHIKRHIRQTKADLERELEK